MAGENLPMEVADTWLMPKGDDVPHGVELVGRLPEVLLFLLS